MASRRLKIALQGAVLAIGLAAAGGGLAAQTVGAASSNIPAAGTVKQLGSIREIHGSRLAIASDRGGMVAVNIQPGARLLRLEPGQTDLKHATAIQVTDLQVGDRVLVRGRMDADGSSLDAATVLVMRHQDIAERQREEMRDWQLRGVGGLVRQVDVGAGTVTIAVFGPPMAGGAQAGAGISRTIVVRTTAQTVFKRYAPNSVKWEEAAASRLDQIHPGDQLRARGNRSVDGTQMEADEIVSGSFRNIAGRIRSIDAAQGTLTVEDLATRKPVTVRITAGSQMKRLPPRLATGLAMRLKGIAPGESEAGASRGGSPEAGSKAAAGANPGGRAAARGRARGGDLNQLLSRLPSVTLADLQQGEAVMIVSTLGSGGKLPNAVTLLSGVEPILAASPGGRGSESLLTPWSLASAPEGDEP